MKKAFLFLVLFCICFVPSAFATAQMPDVLIYNGKEYDLLTNPMEHYFEEHPDLRPQSTSSALWRGYIAYFEIIDNQLILKDIEVERWMENGDNVETVSIYKELFPSEEKIIIDWFTGILPVQDGEMVDYVHMGYGSTYSQYILFQVDKGIVLDIQSFTDSEYKDYKEEQYKAFQKTDKYQQLLKEIKKEKGIKKMGDDFIDNFIRSYSSAEYGNILVPFPKKK